MAISDSKQRMSLVIEKNDKAILEDIAEENDRSVNYVINGGFGCVAMGILKSGIT